jgi:NADH:ubiquinone oxidoreductase subunit 6 (subunit J)
MELAFWTIAAITVIGALLAMTLRNLLYCILSLVAFFIGIAAFFFFLQAEFIAAVQILIYVGAVAVLVLFAIMLTRNITGMETIQQLGGTWWASASLALLVAMMLGWAVLSEAKYPTFAAPDVESSAKAIGETMMNNWVVPLELVAVLLTVAMIGAIVIAMEEVFRRR